MSKPSNFGSGQGKFGRFGQGKQVNQLPTHDTPVTFGNFRGGFDTRQGRETTDNSSPNCIDIELTNEGRLARMEGTVAPTVLAGHKPTQMVLQASLSNLAELVLLDPPFVGVKGAGALAWTDIGLTTSDRPYAVTQFGETLVMGNGVGDVFTKEPGAIPVATPEIPQARSYAPFAARLFALGAIIDGNYEPLGVVWSAANSNPRDFLGEGASFELLITDASSGDEGVAVRAMNLDLLALINKNSIWIGRRTNDVFRPAAFEPRLKDHPGGLTDRTVVSSPIGVAYLSETGVRAFDGNAAPVISDPINAKLLPLDMDNISLYRLTYDPLKNRLVLFTPVCRWDYDIDFQIWYRHSMVAADAAFFTAQVGGTTWAQLQAAGTTWGDLQAAATTWLALSARPVGRADLFFLKGDGVADSEMAQRDTTSEDQFGVHMLPYWETRRSDATTFDQLVTTNKVLTEYVGSGELRIFLPDRLGQLESVMVASILGTVDPRDVAMPMVHTGRGMQLGLRIDSGNLELVKAQVLFDPRSSKINQNEFLPREYRADFNT